MGAARITHRARGVAAIATRWHMVVTCKMNGSIKEKAIPNSAAETRPTQDCRDSQIPNGASSGCPVLLGSSFEARQALGERAFLFHDDTCGLLVYACIVGWLLWGSTNYWLIFLDWLGSDLFAPQQWGLHFVRIRAWSGPAAYPVCFWDVSRAVDPKQGYWNILSLMSIVSFCLYPAVK